MFYGENGVSFDEAARLFIEVALTNSGMFGEYCLTKWDPLGKRYTASFTVPLPIRLRFRLLRWLPKFLDFIRMKTWASVEVRNISILTMEKQNSRILVAMVNGSRCSLEVTLNQ